MSFVEKGNFIDSIRDLKSHSSVSVSHESPDTKVGSQFTFAKGVVQEYISNPVEFLDSDIVNTETSEVVGKVRDQLIFDTPNVKKSRPMVENHSIARYMPLNSIIAYVPEANTPSAEQEPVIAFPFFSQHFVLPLKPGEHVLILKEDIGDESIYYWMTRMSTYRQIDDINFTHMERLTEITKIFSEFLKDGPVSDDSLMILNSYTKSSTSLLPGNLNYNQLAAQSTSILNEFTGEPVPRQFIPGPDMAMQGSNNTLIQLGVEKFRDVELFDQNTFTNPSAKTLSSNKRKTLAGSIDICVGREIERLKELSQATDSPLFKSVNSDEKINMMLGNRSQGGQILEHCEIDKTEELQGLEETIDEGKDGPRDVSARVYVTMNGDPDKSFEIENSDFDQMEGSTVVNYAENIRNIAENNLRLYVYPPKDAPEDNPGGSIIQMASDGTITLQAGQGEKAAKIILKSTGDIILKPGSSGLLHLGGDETETTHAVCGSTLLVPPAAVPTGGVTSSTLLAGTGTVENLEVTTAGSTDSSGGTAFIGDPLSGVSSSKVVIKG